MIRFLLNNQLIETDLPAGSTVLDFVRYHKRITGTKIGCREGDCGACTVLTGDIENGRIAYSSMTSCLMPLGNANGKHIVTVEGVNMDRLSPVQQALVETNGTQCGFCTPGFVMSLTGFVLNKNSGSYEDAVKAIDGNICRCTGYKSIERAAKIITEKMAEKPAGGNISWLVENKFIPAWFNGIESRLQELKQLEADHNLDSGSMIIGGGTDLIVQKHGSVKKADTWHLFDAAHLKGVFEVDGKCRIGASTTVTEFAASPVINAAFPEINKYIKLVSSTPIRNMATLAGNLVNASPIGDMTIFFLALDTALVLSNEVTKRTVMLRDFYKGYKVIDKAPEEYIEQLVFDLPSPGSVFNFEKVCKRTHLDIASVNTACLFSLGVSGEIENIHLAAGGVAPFPKYLFNTVNWLKGKKIEATVLKEALQIMNEEIAPIGDARGSEVYKRLLLRQLFLAHFEKQISDLKNLVTGLPVVSHKI